MNKPNLVRTVRYGDQSSGCHRGGGRTGRVRWVKGLNCMAKKMKSALLTITFLFFPDHSSQFRVSLVAQMVKCLPAVRETWVRSLGREDPLEKEMTTHSSTLAWKIPWTEEPDRLQSTGSQRVRHD